MKKKIGSDYFKEFINIGDLKPNGKGLFTFVRYDTDLQGDQYKANLFLFDMEKNRVSDQLTFENKVGLHQWLDDEHLMITALREQADKDLSEKGIPLTVFYRFHIHTKQYKELFRVHKNVCQFARIDDNKYLLLADDSLLEDEYLSEAGGNWDKYAAIVKRESKYFVADEVPFWTDGGGHANKKRGRLFLFDGGFLKQLSADDFSVCDVKACKEHYGLFYGVDSGSVQKTEGKLYKIEYDTMDVVPLDETNHYIYTYIQPLDRDRILVCRNDRRFHGEYQNEYIDVIDLKSGTFTRNNGSADVHLYDNVVNDITYLTGWLNKITVTDDGLLFIATRGGASKLYYSAFGSDKIKAVTGQGKILDYFVQDNTIYMTAMRGLSGPEIYCKKLNEEKEIRLSNFNNHLEESYAYAQVESCNFINSDEIEIEGWIMAPTDFDENQKYPVILFIHGGPGSAYGPVLNHDMQVMCAKGYGVIYCNPRGSEGRGGAFADIRTKWGTVDYDDLMEFVDGALKRYSWIDEERLGITGGSYGGIMTNWIIGHTQKFQAAVSDRSVSNLLGDCCMSDIGFACNKDTYGVTPWQNPEYLWEQSALKYAPSIKTPVLFLHGIEDYRCTCDHSLQLHSAITYFGGVSRVFAFKGESHELCRSGSPQNRQRRIDEMVKWFEQYL